MQKQLYLGDKKMHKVKSDRAKLWALQKIQAKKDYAEPILNTAKKETPAYASSNIGELDDFERIALDYALGEYVRIPSAYLPLLSEINEAGATTAEDIKGWSEVLITNKLVAARIRPPWFTHKANCQRCGEIPLDFKAEGELVGCPWCHSS